MILLREILDQGAAPFMFLWPFLNYRSKPANLRASFLAAFAQVEALLDITAQVLSVSIRGNGFLAQSPYGSSVLHGPSYDDGTSIFHGSPICDGTSFLQRSTLWNGPTLLHAFPFRQRSPSSGIASPSRSHAQSRQPSISSPGLDHCQRDSTERHYYVRPDAILYKDFHLSRPGMG